MDWFLVSFLNGISLGAILFLIAAGFSLIFGVMSIANLAHGALYMLGTYVGWSIAVQFGLNFWLAVLAGGLTAGVVGLLMERGFLRQLYGQLNEQVLLTFGFVYILTNLTQWLWGPSHRVGFTAQFFSGSFNIGDLSFPIARVAITIIGLVLAIGLWWMQNKTQVGAILRAGRDDRDMTMALGMNLKLISIIIFFLGSFIAGAGGVVGAYLFGVNLQLSIDILILALIVVVVGGMGSVEGALLGSMLIGLVDSFGRGLFPEFAMFTMFLAMIIILVVRPIGLLGRKA